MSSQPSYPPGSPFTIEPASWRDLNAMRSLEKICFPVDAWPLFDLIGVLTFSNIVRLKAVADDRMVGFVAGDIRHSENMAWIATLGVLPEYRRRGIGAALLRACEERLDVPNIRLCVRSTNHEAIPLYEHFGYQRVGIWPKYYHDGEDAVIMEKRKNGV
jgi:ribosomal protein S18 acetylase RimI-like enzyme